MDLFDVKEKRILLILTSTFLLLLLPFEGKSDSLSVFPLSNAVVRRKGTALNVFCEFSSTLTDRKASNDHLTWLFLPLKERRRGSRQPRVKYSDSRTAILRHDDSTSELKIAPLQLEDAGHYACASHWNSAEFLGDQIRIDVYVDSGNKSHCDATEFRCSTGDCLPSQYRCDRFDNCPDGSDEDGCGDACFDGFLCRNNRCLDPRLRCDRMHDNNCGDWSDEAGCSFQSSALTRRSEEEVEEEKVDAELAASRKELADYRLTLYVAIGCVAGLVFVVLAVYCVVQIGYGEEMAAIATIEAISRGKEGGRRISKEESSSSDRFANLRKLDEIMEGIEKEELGGCLSDERRRSWVIVDGDEEDEAEEEEEEEGVDVDTPFLNDGYNPKPHQSTPASDSNYQLGTPSVSIPPLMIGDSRSVSFNPESLVNLKPRKSILTPDSGLTYRDESPLEDDVFELGAIDSTPPVS